jgi:hypothetical protein
MRRSKTTGHEALAAAYAFLLINHRFPVIKRNRGHGAGADAITAPDASRADNHGFAQLLHGSRQRHERTKVGYGCKK